jgi:hypothetical protein
MNNNICNIWESGRPGFLSWRREGLRDGRYRGQMEWTGVTERQLWRNNKDNCSREDDPGLGLSRTFPAAFKMLHLSILSGFEDLKLSIA